VQLPQQLVGDAAQEESSRPGPAMGAHDDEVGRPGANMLGNGIGRRAVEHRSADRDVEPGAQLRRLALEM
jgi:hypothetical protein